MIKNSRIAMLAVSFWKWLVTCYENSFIMRAINAFCGFFTKRADFSLFCRFFRRHRLTTDWWRSSVSEKAVLSPVALLKRISASIGDAFAHAREGSVFSAFLKKVFDVPLRDYGLLLLPFSAAFTASLFVFKNTETVYLCVGGALLLIAAVMLLFRQSIYSLYDGSAICRLFTKAFDNCAGDLKKDHSPYRIKFRFFKILALAAIGFICGCSPTVAFVSLAAAIGAAMVMLEPIIAAMLIAMLAPIMPTVLMAALCALAFISLCIRLATHKDVQYVKTPFNLPIILFLLIAVVTTLTGVAPSSGIKILLVYIVFALAYVVIVNTVKTRGAWNTLVTFFVIGALLVAAYGIIQNFFVTGTTASWVDSEMFGGIEKRVYSTLDNPNVLGQFLMLAIPVAFAMMVALKGSLKKAMYLFGELVMFACLMYTWSRGAWVGVVLSLGFFVLLRDKRWLVVCVIGLLLMPSVLPQSILQRLTSIGNMADSSSAYRVSVWTASFRLAKDHLLSGIGIGSDAFSLVYPQYALNGAGFALHSHNFFIQLVVEMGIFGLLAFVGIIITACKSIISAKCDKATFAVIFAMGCAFVGYAFQGLVENLWYNYRMVLIFFIYLAIIQSGANLPESEAEKT